MGLIMILISKRTSSMIKDSTAFMNLPLLIVHKVPLKRQRQYSSNYSGSQPIPFEKSMNGQCYWDKIEILLK